MREKELEREREKPKEKSPNSSQIRNPSQPKNSQLNIFASQIAQTFLIKLFIGLLWVLVVIIEIQLSSLSLIHQKLVTQFAFEVSRNFFLVSRLHVSISESNLFPLMKDFQLIISVSFLQISIQSFQWIKGFIFRPFKFKLDFLARVFRFRASISIAGLIWFSVLSIVAAQSSASSGSVPLLPSVLRLLLFGRVVMYAILFIFKRRGRLNLGKFSPLDSHLFSELNLSWPPSIVGSLHFLFFLKLQLASFLFWEVAGANYVGTHLEILPTKFRCWGMHPFQDSSSSTCSNVMMSISIIFLRMSLSLLRNLDSP
ncbi:uncharacterized protein LOC130590447 [Beta vulgaris subsp. vulgaris]|uniref:uncharacterized protein LOC130590447 n=1 Tax=Beta vulgaris subsp. vulgaris TaxID=3555 RepID=UPI0025471A74|nr:uncharacterized protein LOC130590447 [Beta vulgaris subsp. vulgaris]